ncbi:MAG: hypothetical protein HQL82_15435 [Magnetococcales bacterium]|nr:hypothetical protein [Magnetococcales bacterium]
MIGWMVVLALLAWPPVATAEERIAGSMPALRVMPRMVTPLAANPLEAPEPGRALVPSSSPAVPKPALETPLPTPFVTEDPPLSPGDRMEGMVVDALVCRPMGLVATVTGVVLYTLSLPFSLAGGNLGDAGETLVLEPVAFTFQRPLGGVGCSVPANPPPRRIGIHLPE